ncbi:sulfate transport protein [Acinetobacter haemolyticus]|nr:sulfate transport protein [Acinetobacter haemolyticus]
MRLSQLKVGLLAALLSASSLAAQDFLNVSYDPTRELYTDFNKQFGNFWKQRTGQDINFRDLCTKQPLCSRHTTKPKKNKEWQ